MSRVVVVALVALAAFGACYFASEEGRPCDTSGACDIRNLECVPVDGDGVCLPIVAHDKTTCDVDADCADALFPIEAACEGGLCRCRLTPCDGENVQIVDRVHCVCVDSEGALDEFCNDDDDCASGLHCEQSQCSRPSRLHDACEFDTGCGAGLDCSCADVNCDTGECLVDNEGPCALDGDCASGTCDDFDFDGSGTCAPL